MFEDYLLSAVHNSKSKQKKKRKFFLNFPKTRNQKKNLHINGLGNFYEMSWGKKFRNVTLNSISYYLLNFSVVGWNKKFQKCITSQNAIVKTKCPTRKKVHN